MEVLTSDTDAPGPYVGAYPFRMSLQQQQEKQQQQFVTDQSCKGSHE